MSITLTKATVGQKVNLSKSTSEGGEGTLTKVKVGLGWDANTAGGADFDGDVSIVFTDGNEKAVEGGFLYYGSKKNEEGKLIVGDYAMHTGDNLTGEGEGDDEAVILDLSKVPANIVKAIIYVTIYEATKRGQNFGMMNNSFVRIVNEDTGSEITKLELDFDADVATAVRFGTLIRRNDEWYFSAEKISIEKGLEGVVAKHEIS